MSSTNDPHYVIKANDLSALNYLAPDHPRPLKVEWIDRSRDRKLRPSSVAMLLRTMSNAIAPASVVRLHRTAGLRALFRDESERLRFAVALAEAKNHEARIRPFQISAVFPDLESARRAIAELMAVNVAKRAISLLCRASQFMDPDSRWPVGHYKFSVIAATAGGGMAGAALAAGVLLIPGVGPIAAVGALASAALPPAATFGGILGAMGGSMARMLSDHDVDGISAKYYAEEVRRGRIFLSIDTRKTNAPRAEIRRILRDTGGRHAPRA